MSKFQVGSFEVLPQHNKIVSNGEEIRLEPKIMQVLEHLILHKGEVLSREQIIQALWPEQVVGHEVITRAIFELRKYFGDDPKQPLFIETIPRKGYSFVHDYELVESIPEKVSKNILLPISVVICACVIIWLIFTISLTTEEAPPKTNKPDIETILLENSEHRISDHQLSPEQTSVVYVRRQGDFWLLKTMVLDTLHKSVLVESKLPLRSPMWVTERKIVYVKCDEEHCDIVEKDIVDNKQKILHRTPKRLVKIDLDVASNIIVAEVVSRTSRYLQLFSLATEKELDAIELPYSLVRKPIFSTDGQSLFFVSTNKTENPKIHRWHLAQKQVMQTVDLFNRVFGYTEISDERLLVAGRKQGITGVWQVNLQDNTSTLLTASSIGEFINAVDARGDGSKWISASLQRNVDTYATQNIQLLDGINSSMIDMNAVWDSINNRVFYVSNRSGNYELWQTDTSGTRKLTSLDTNLINRPILSNDKRKIAFMSPLKRKSQIHILELNNDAAINTIELPGEIQLLSWSSDNQFLYYSAYERENYHIFKYSIAERHAEPVLISAGFMLYEDAKTGDFYYIDTQEKRLMRQNKFGEIEQLSSTLKNSWRLRPLQAVVDDGALLYIAMYEGRPTLVKYDIATQSYESLETLPRGAYVTQIIKQHGEWLVVYDITHPDKSRLYQSTAKSRQK